jgi:hypothetical protein
MSDYLRVQKGANEYIDPSIVNIDFEVEVPSDQGLGWESQSDDEMLASTPDVESFSNVFPQHMVPRSQWKERIDRIWRMMRATTVQIVSQGQEGSCLPPNTLIRMADGSLKQIQDIRLLDKVLTAEGNIGVVKQTFVREAKEILRLDIWGHRHLRMTDEHPVFTERGYVKAGELEVGDWVAFPKFLPESSSIILKENHVVHTREYVVRNKKKISCVSGGVQGRSTAVITKCPVPDIIQMTKGFGRIIGLFLAEGSTDNNKTVWTFNINERETLAQELIDLLYDELGVEARLKSIEEKNTCKVYVYGKQWSMLFESLCSSGSQNKRLHQEICSGPKDFMEGILFGWLDGDGYKRRGYYQGVTVSRELAHNMYDIAQALGKMPSISTSFPKISHGVKTRCQRWDVYIQDGHGEDYHCRKTVGNTVWRKVREIHKEEYSGYVYNFEVEGDNSYVAEGIGVHNCVGFACTQALETTLTRRFGRRHWVDLSGVSLYKRIGRSASSGAYIPDGIKEIRERGVLPVNSPVNIQNYRHTHPRTGFSRVLPNGWTETAKLFRASRVATCRGADEIFSALFGGFCGVVGRSRHAVPYVYPQYSGNTYYCVYANSWGSSWGSNGGFGFDSESVFRNLTMYVILDVVIRPEFSVPKLG